MIVKNQEALVVPCTYCGAAVNNYCRTSSGAVTYTPHSARIALFKTTYTPVRLLRPVLGRKG